MRAMRANNVSPNTILAYGGAVRQFGRWLMDHDYPTDVAAIEPRHVEEWIGSHPRDQQAGDRAQPLARAATVHQLVRDEVDDFRSPDGEAPPAPAAQAHAAGPHVRRAPGHPRHLHRARRFEDRRDNALIRMLFDTGARRHEIAACATPRPTLRTGTWTCAGRRSASWARAARTTIALRTRPSRPLDDYLRVRRKHPHAAEPWLWLGKRGRLTDSGIAQAIRDRGARVGIPDLHAHDFRHAATHHELAGGMNEADVMSKRGWDCPGDAPALRVDDGQRAGDRGEPEARPGRQAVTPEQRAAFIESCLVLRDLLGSSGVLLGSSGDHTADELAKALRADGEKLDDDGVIRAVDVTLREATRQLEAMGQTLRAAVEMGSDYGAAFKSVQADAARAGRSAKTADWARRARKLKDDEHLKSPEIGRRMAREDGRPERPYDPRQVRKWLSRKVEDRTD